MTKIDDVLDLPVYEEDVKNGYIRVQQHPLFPQLFIANYTEKTQFEKHWTSATRICRGLIFDVLTREVLARPFQKIHNWDEPEAPKINLDAPLYHVGNKEDGSLGIIFEYDMQLQVATRGSFASDQAIHANEWLEIYYESAVIDWSWEMLDAGYTPLVEIVYPENRIVLNYGGDDVLIPLGAVSIETGAFIPPVVRRNA